MSSKTRQPRRRSGLNLATATIAFVGAMAAPLNAQDTPAPAATLPWMAPAVVAQQSAAGTDAGREAVAARRAAQLIMAMTLPQKLQQLTGSRPEILPELPECYGARHVSGIAALGIPTFRISNGPVGVGQNDCVSLSVYEAAKKSNTPYASHGAYTHPTSAKATALPSAMAVAASFDLAVAADFGTVIATEMNNLGLHVFEAPGVNLARLPILGRNFEYFGEDPFLTGSMAVAETRAVQSQGLIAMVKHFVANEQETNRQTIQETVDHQTLRELYLLPFEMALKDGNASAVMCAYNYVNGTSSCENRELLTDVLRRDWGFTGYVQSDFFAMKSTAPTLQAGLDHEMPTPQYWSAAKLTEALNRGEIDLADIDTALQRRFTQMFKAGIFDRPLVQTPIDFASGGRMARAIGTRGAVLLQNNGALPLPPSARSVVLVGKTSQVYARQAVAGGSMTGKPMGAGGGSSDVVPAYTVSPLEGLAQALEARGDGTTVKLILVDDENAAATIDGQSATFSAALKQAAKADSVLIMAGTVSEEGADRATFDGLGGRKLAAGAATGTSLDWYADKPNVLATNSAKDNPARNSGTVAMIKAILATPSANGTPMARKSTLVLKDNAGVAMDPALVGKQGPSILEVWFPGQEDGNIVADLVTGKANPSGKLPVTFAYQGKGFLDHVTARQFPGVAAGPKNELTVEYTERLAIGYRWYDANVSGNCKPARGNNPCVAFPFGHGLSYTSFALGKPSLVYDGVAKVYRTRIKVTNTGKRAGAEVLQAYVALPAASASMLGAAQPPRRLVGFAKAQLEPGTSATVEITIDPTASNHPFGVWDDTRKAWVIPQGAHAIWVGRSSSTSDLVKAGIARF